MRNAMLPMLLLVVTPASALADTPAHHPPSPGTLDVTSPAFGDNQGIPAEHTCEGNNVSPPLTWSRVPAGTRSIAILVDDPDAPRGTFTHWLVTGISPAVTSLGKGAPLPEGALAAKNDMGSAGYAGPCPPSGRHRYQFRVYALDVKLGKAMTRAELLAAIRGHVLATGALVGTYEKQAGRTQR
jgi:Raf kinase inhibitor-like YbhB/YbcL family protein